MRKLILLFTVIFILFFSAFILAEDTPISSGEESSQSNPSASDVVSSTSTDSSASVATETQTTIAPENSEDKDIDEKIAEEKVELKAEPGITPDSPIYFVKDIYQRIAVGSNPERALNYKEQKIAEAKVMVEEGKPEKAEKVLDRALQYSEIIEKEASPEMKDRVQESRAAVENAIKDMEEKTKGSEWKDVQEKFKETIEKEKEIGTAAELAAKISELCASLAQLDPLQYADTCKPKDNSPRWIIEKDKELSSEQEEQAKVFFEKLSQCFESPENCDCKGMGIQKFEDFCLEKSKMAVKCKQGDENACKEAQSSDPIDLLPEYLIPVLNQVQNKYVKAQYDMYMPEECVKQGAKKPEDCMKIMFKFNAPKECIDTGLTGKSKEDEIKCEKIMFEKNAPKECLDAGINSNDKDASRKCAKIMFMQRAPQECINTGITGEGRDDEKKCRQLMASEVGGFRQRPVSEEGPQKYNGQKFNRDCNKIQDSNEKMKCYEEFYNNAQVQFNEDFVQREVKDTRTGEIITPEEENARQQCRSKGMDTILEYEGGRRIIICVEKGQAGSNGGRCQSQDETEKLKQDCTSRGQNANVENRGGCPWVICMGGDYRGDYSTGVGRTYAPGTVPNQYQQPSNRIDQPQQPSQNTGGIKCPDGTCDDYEKMNPWACPEDCGGSRQQPTENIIVQPQQPNQQNFCPGQAPSCAPNGAPYCQNGNWVCPPAPQQEAPQQPQVPQEPQQPQQIIQEPPAPQQPIEGSSAVSTESTPPPATGSAITGRIITSVYGDENTRDGDKFLDYWFER